MTCSVCREEIEGSYWTFHMWDAIEKLHSPKDLCDGCAETFSKYRKELQKAAGLKSKKRSVKARK